MNLKHRKVEILKCPKTGGTFFVEAESFFGGEIVLICKDENGCVGYSSSQVVIDPENRYVR